MAENKSCIDCPSYLTVDESKNFFKKQIGVPVCARFGKPMQRLDSTNVETKATMESLATSCSEFGNPRPQIPQWDKAEFQVMLPITDITPQNQPTLVNTCQSCTFFVRDDIVVSEKGFAAGLCGAKGRLLLNNRHTYYARNCDVKSLGAPNGHETISGMYFLPEYEPGFLGSADPALIAKRNAKHLVDPRTYETDEVVSDEEKARGIRAWRKIEDQGSDRFVLLPIYDGNYFDLDELSKVPQIGDKEHPEDYLDHFGGTYKLAVLWMKLDETPAAWGQAGTGKTEFFRHMAWLMQLPFYRFSITGSTELDDLAGKMHFENGGTVFKYGRLPHAWSRPSVIVVDEPNTGQPEVWQFLRPLTDNSKQLVMDMNEGERIDRHRDCYMGMAMNPAWDMRNIGTNQIGDADANRMMHMKIELPPEVIEKRIIKAACAHDGYDIPDETLQMVYTIGQDIRALCDSGALTMSWAIRPQIKVARALAWFDPLSAYRMASADYLDEEQSSAVMRVVKSVVE
jgi:MoxR-like ATPase